MQLRITCCVYLLASFVAAMCGCKKEPAPSTPPAPAADATPAAPLPYKIPDKLPARATLALVKTEDNTATYKVTFGQTFAFDPDKADLALDVNTVGWKYHGRIVITDKNDSEAVGAQTHEELYDQPPTTDQLDLPEEHVLIGPIENGWIKAGGITLFIRNAEGDGSTPPKVLTVDLVEK